ncbi:MAG: FkbM family methyltransferase [archaeon]
MGNGKDLIFDIGASRGYKSKMFLDLGFRVIAVEPIKRNIKFMQKKFQNYGRKIKIIRAGVSNKVSFEKLRVCASESFSTFSDEQVKMFKESKDTENLEWFKEEKVRMITLEYLISRYGLPKFIKIDVEGNVLKVLEGLSKRVDLISFEYNSLNMGPAISCIQRISSLGDYKFNISRGESTKFTYNGWLGKKEILRRIRLIKRKPMQYGDIYAKKAN